MSDPTRFHFKLPRRGRPGDVTLIEPWYPGIQKYWPACSSRRAVDPIAGITTVVIHATAGSSSQGAISAMKRAENPASFHWLVPDENEAQHGHLVWACVPEALAAWHVRGAASHAEVNGGARRVNHWSLGIELVNSQRNDPFSDWQLTATARIVRYCWAKYPNLVDVVSHAKLDPDRRSDPGADFGLAALQDAGHPRQRGNRDPRAGRAGNPCRSDPGGQFSRPALQACAGRGALTRSNVPGPAKLAPA